MARALAVAHVCACALKCTALQLLLLTAASKAYVGAGPACGHAGASGLHAPSCFSSTRPTKLSLLHLCVQFVQMQGYRKFGLVHSSQVMGAFCAYAVLPVHICLMQIQGLA